MILFDGAREEIQDCLRSALLGMAGDGDWGAITLEIPPDLSLGDFSFPAFRLAKLMRRPPQAIAKEMAEKIAALPQAAGRYEVDTAGAYVNFRVKRGLLLGDVLDELLLSGRDLAGRPVRDDSPVIVEFSSPNVAKPFNIYHLRSTMIGNCLVRVFQARGRRTIAINHLGDWGTQYGALAVAYAKWGDDEELARSGIAYLVELYVRINKAMETDPALLELSRQYFARLERGDEEVQKVWRKFVELSLSEFRRVYDRLDVKFDYFMGESSYVAQVPALEEELGRKDLLRESEGAEIVDLEAWGMPPCIIRKADGSTIYASRDLAAALYRFDKFGFGKCVYVVGGEQKLHFAQVFKVLELMGRGWSANCVHVGFGLYRFKDAKMSTRKGNFITMEAVLDAAVERALQLVREKNSELSNEECLRLAEIVGTGAVVYNDLSTDRGSDVHFDLDRVLDFNGTTGPYVQYAHTRCLSILRNAPPALMEGVNVSDLMSLSAPPGAFKRLAADAKEKLRESEELDLVRVLARLPLVLDRVLDEYRPSLLAEYLIDVTRVFNVFYAAHKVLGNEETVTRARLALVLATQRVLLRGLNLLGMRAPERM